MLPDLRPRAETLAEAKADRLEAECRRRMAFAARIEVRGFDTRKAKDDAIAEVDRVLDEWAAASG